MQPSIKAVAVTTLSSIALLASLPARAATDNLGLPTVPLTLTNNTGSGSDLYITVLGMVGSTWYSVTDANGDVQAAPDTTAYGDYSVNVGTAQTVSLNVPQLVGARIYVSVGQPLSLPGGSGVPGAPAGWVASDPNYGVPFDWIEYTWNGGGLGGNTTQVDMFGLALSISITGDGGTQSSGFPTSSGDHVRTTILNALAGDGSPWNALVVDGANGSPLRAISPYHGIENNVFPSDELQSYLDQAFSQYPNGGLTTTSDGGSFNGVTTGSAMVFTNTANGESFTIPEPSTYTAYTGGLAASPTPSDATLAAQAAQVAAQLQASLLRTTLLADDGNLVACNTANFYKTSPVDEYSLVMHQNATNGLTYGFGFDDECGQSSYINVTGPTAMTLSVGPLD